MKPKRPILINFLGGFLVGCLSCNQANIQRDLFTVDPLATKLIEPKGSKAIEIELSTNEQNCLKGIVHRNSTMSDLMSDKDYSIVVRETNICSL